MKAQKMNAKLLFLALCLTTLAACKKDKYDTKPKLKFEKVSNPVLSNVNQILKFTLSVTDKEGDIQDTLWIQKITLNCSSGNFISKYKIPEFTPQSNLSAELSLSFQKGTYFTDDYIYGPITRSQCNKNDTSIFKFWIQDKAKNKSDTVTSPTIVITK